MALINRRNGAVSIVVFHASGDTVAFERILEMPSEDRARSHLATEGYTKSRGRVRMVDRKDAGSLPPAPDAGSSRIEPGQVWQNGRVVVSVQRALEGLNLVEFEISGRRLRFTGATPFKDEEKAARYIRSLDCGLTDKVLAAATESASAI